MIIITKFIIIAIKCASIIIKYYNFPFINAYIGAIIIIAFVNYFIYNIKRMTTLECFIILVTYVELKLLKFIDIKFLQL